MHIEQALAGYTLEQICQCADEPTDTQYGANAAMK